MPTPDTQRCPFGLCAGQFIVPADFDRPLPDDLLGSTNIACLFAC